MIKAAIHIVIPIPTPIMLEICFTSDRIYNEQFFLNLFASYTAQGFSTAIEKNEGVDK